VAWLGALGLPWAFAFRKKNSTFSLLGHGNLILMQRPDRVKKGRETALFTAIVTVGRVKITLPHRVGKTYIFLKNER